MRTKAEVERHHDMDRVGNLWRCADRCGGDSELMIESDSNQEFAPMPKPTTDEPASPGDAPDAATAPRWVLPPNFRDVTAERIGERIALIAPPQRVKPKD
jgi:hypothetical protein